MVKPQPKAKSESRMTEREGKKKNKNESSNTMRNPSTATRNNNGSKTPCCSKVGLKRGPWTPEEDKLLATYINKEGEGRWRTLPKRAGLLRCGKSCRLRWMNYLRPSVKRGQIAPDEEDLILRLHRLLGNRWSLIAGRIPGRTDNEIKNYWNTHLRKKLISQGIDPTTHKPLKLNPQTQTQTQTQPQLKPSSSFSSSSKIPMPNIHPEASSSSLEETSIMAMCDKLEEHEFFQINHYQTDDDAAVIRGHGFTSLLNCDGSSGLQMIGSSNNQNQNQNQKISNDEEDEDVNYFTDDGVFSSFLNSLINEDPFLTNYNQNQMQQQQQGWEYISHHDFLFNQNNPQEG